MYSQLLIGGMMILLLALLAAAAFIALHRARRSGPQSRFAAEFIDGLNRLGEIRKDEIRKDEIRKDEIIVDQTQTETPQGSKMLQQEAYALHQRGEPTFRIASALGIARADAELLIKIEESVRGKSRD